jgi:ribosomal protein L31E
MAKEKEPKIILERTYNVPLRRRWMHVPKYKRAKKAVTTLKDFLMRHMKPGADEKGRILLKIGKHANELIWKHGIRNPPHHIKIVTKKDDKGLVTAELEGAPVEEKKEAKKKAEPKKKEHEVKVEEATKEKKQEAAKEIEKEEIKELKREKPREQHKLPPMPKKQLSKPTAPKSA